MTDRWKYLSLSEAGVELIDCIHKTPPAKSEGRPYVGIPQIKNGRIDFTGARLISHEDYIKWRQKVKPLEWDVVLSRRCNPGTTAHVTKQSDFALGQNLVLLRSNGTHVYPPYLRWVTQSPLWWNEVKKYLNVGAVFDSLKCADIPLFTFPLPSLPEQKRIAEILGSLDDKIELNRKQNETLEAMARAVFQSWFVDFDPVIDKAIAAGHPIPDELAEKTARRKHHKNKHPLPQAIQSLFPDRFEPSPLGPIPKGWKVKSLDNIADFLNGLACQKYPPENDLDSLPVIKIRELRQGITDNADRATSNVPEKYIIQDGDVLFSWSGSLLVKIWCEGYGVLNQHVFKVSSADYPKWFYYYWTHHHLEVFQGIAADKATTMGHIQRRHLSDAKTLIPDEKLLDKMSKTITPLLDKQIDSELESRTLTRLRDSLLPKLLTGEVKVEE